MIGPLGDTYICTHAPKCIHIYVHKHTSKHTHEHKSTHTYTNTHKSTQKNINIHISGPGTGKVAHPCPAAAPPGGSAEEQPCVGLRPSHAPLLWASKCKPHKKGNSGDAGEPGPVDSFGSLQGGYCANGLGLQASQGALGQAVSGRV